MRKLLLLAAGVFFFAGCAGTDTGPVKDLDVRVSPQVITYGVASTVRVKATDGEKLKWVKGTVVFPGYDVPEVKLKYNKDEKVWLRKFPPVPSFFQLKAGKYTVKVWAKGRGGKRYEGSAQVEFKKAR